MKAKVVIDEKALKEVIRDAAESWASGQTYEISCPHCGKTVEVPPGLRECPECGGQINLNLNFNL